MRRKKWEKNSRANPLKKAFQKLSLWIYGPFDFKLLCFFMTLDQHKKKERMYEMKKKMTKIIL